MSFDESQIPNNEKNVGWTARVALAPHRSSFARASVTIPSAVITHTTKKKYPNGDEYIGDMTKEGRRHGRGVHRYRDGGSYDGEWRDDNMDGMGKLTVPAYTYTGEFADGQLAGWGTMWFKSGNVYEGEFHNGHRWGQGTYRYKSGAQYTGGWRDGRKHGRGIYTYEDSTVYEGEFHNGWHSGQGTVRLPDGLNYRKNCHKTPYTAR